MFGLSFIDFRLAQRLGFFADIDEEGPEEIDNKITPILTIVREETK